MVPLASFPDSLWHNCITFEPDRIKGVACTGSLATGYLTNFCFSVALNKLVKKLDKRVEQSNQSRQGFKKKARILKSPAKCAVPHGFPKWAVDISSHVESPSTHVRSRSLQPRRLSTSHPPPSPSSSQSSSSLSSFSSSDSEIED